MKKLLTILLVLLVAGFVFAAGEELAGGNATLTLNSEVSQKTKHGFYNTAEKASAASIFEISDPNLIVPATSINLEEKIDVLQPVGFYSFASTSSKGVNISISGSAFELDTEGTKHYVPYKLSFGLKGNANVTDNTSKDLVFSSLAASTSKPDAVTLSLLEAGGETSVKWATYELKLIVDGEANTTYGLPEGSYVATVTATITAD